MKDASVLVRDIAGDAAQNAANKVNPGEEELSRIDEPAQDNTWHDAPDLSKDNLKKQAQAKIPIGKKDLEKAAGDVNQAADPNNSRDPNQTADLAAREAQQGQKNTSIDPKAGAQQAKENAKKLYDERVDEEDKQKAREYREKTNEYFKKKMPKERREQTMYVWNRRPIKDTQLTASQLPLEEDGCRDPRPLRLPAGH